MHQYLPHSIAISLSAIAFLVVVLNTVDKAGQVLAFQSELPAPKPAANPYYIPAATGGNVFCGVQQSPVWLHMPGGYLDGDGAEIHCDKSTSDLAGANGAWDGAIYLIGIYSPPALLKPVNMVFEIDRARIDKVCTACWSGRFYNSANKQWRNLPTTFNVGTGRVYVTIADILPPSQVPGYADRFAVALFVQTQGDTPSPSAIATKRSVPTIALSPTTTSAAVPPPTAIVVIGSTLASSPIPTRVSTPVQPTLAPQPAAIPSTSNESGTQNESIGSGAQMIGVLAVGIIVGVGITLFVTRRGRAR